MRVVVWSLKVEPFQSEMRYVTSLLGRLGYRASIKFPGDSNYFGAIGDSRNRAQVGETAWKKDYADPSNFIDQQFRCSAFQSASPSNINVSEYCDLATDALIAKAEALATTNSQAANLLWARIDRRIVDQVPDAPEYVPRAIDFVSRRVGNYQYSPQWGVLIDQLWIR
jgi:peptide/nickel transport system substrate-binding protein